jgi:hypothetical protein
VKAKIAWVAEAMAARIQISRIELGVTCHDDRHRADSKIEASGPRRVREVLWDLIERRGLLTGC